MLLSEYPEFQKIAFRFPAEIIHCLWILIQFNLIKYQYKGKVNYCLVMILQKKLLLRAVNRRSPCGWELTFYGSFSIEIFSPELSIQYLLACA